MFIFGMFVANFGLKLLRLTYVDMCQRHHLINLIVIHRNPYFGFGRNRNRNPLGSAETETGTETETLWNNLLLYCAKIRFAYTNVL